MVVEDEKTVGFAIDLVKFDQKYESAFKYVFHDTIVVKDLTNASIKGSKNSSTPSDPATSREPNRNLSWGTPLDSAVCLTISSWSS